MKTPVCSCSSPLRRCWGAFDGARPDERMVSPQLQIVKLNVDNRQSIIICCSRRAQTALKQTSEPTYEDPDASPAEDRLLHGRGGDTADGRPAPRHQTARPSHR